MSADSDDDEYDQIAELDLIGKTSLKRRLDESIAKRPNLVNTLVADGKISTTMISLFSICIMALHLSQLEYTIYGNIDASKEALLAPTGRLASLGFKQMMSLIQEGIRNERNWDGELPGLGTEFLHVLCFILSGKLTEFAVEYACSLEPDLFQPVDYNSSTALMIRHMVSAALGNYGEINPNAYSTCRDFKKGALLFKYQPLMQALAEGDDAAFNTQLIECGKAFKRRKNSRVAGMVYGFGEFNRVCFDIIAVALSRLAVARGMTVISPDPKIIPPIFITG